MSQPPVPPRPARSQAPQGTTSTTAAPVVPPRPAGRRDDRSGSPSFPRSPLNDNPFPVDASNDLQRVASLNASRSTLDLPARPPSVTFPSIGQEGHEYDASTPQEEEVVELSTEAANIVPTHTRKVSSDLPLHAPRPSLSSSDAKQRVAAVVRTDSTQAAAQKIPNKLKPKPSFQRPGSSSSHHERPGSAYEDEHGIPTFGQQVPLGSQYGDVQAPSPAPGSPMTPHAPGFDNSRPSTGRHHARKHSGRNDFQAPPGSYGLHGHGVRDTADPFEKDWLQKHPDALKEEIAAHSPAILDRHDYNLSAAELNKLVKQHKQAGFAASGHVGMPDEQIGYLVSEKYSTRGETPNFENTKPVQANVPSVDSPLKRASMSAEDLERAQTVAGSHDGTVHVDAPAYKESKFLGRGQAAVDEHTNLGPDGGSSDRAGGWHDESGYGVPILASDEVDPEGNFLQPAVPPERRGSAQHDDYGYSRPNSRPNSRPGSIHGMSGLNRVISRNEHQLEDVREYEPLFPEEDEKSAKKAATPAERFKQRPDMKQRFPSRDIWEDAPASVMMSAEVETPEEEPQVTTKPAFETPEAESARKGEISEKDKAQLLPREVRLAQSAFQPHMKHEMRPGTLKQRFPSRDIWEDSPDSTYMTTTVGEEEEETNLADEAGAVVSSSSTLPREGATAGAPAVSLPEDGANKSDLSSPPVRSISPGKVAPQIPARPARRPSPQTDKPSVPPRPAKASQLSPEEAPTESSAESAGSARSIDGAAATKAKPQVPARPMGNKIAALQAGFMSDLNKKLGLGPQGPPPKKEEAEEQPEEEKKPLEDARKGRARGPARRKPAVSPSAAAAAPAQQPQSRKFVVTPVYNLYDISPGGDLTATHAETWAEKLEFKDGLNEAAKDIGLDKDASISGTVPPAVGLNTAGEAVHATTATPEAVRSTAQSASTSAIASGPADAGAQATTSTESAEAELAKLKKTRTSSSGTQTGEMNITLDKSGSNPQTLTAYKDGSAHEEGYAFVKEDQKKVAEEE